MPKVWNKRDPNCPKDAVYVGRPSKWGNPHCVQRIYNVFPWMTQEDAHRVAVGRYKEWLSTGGSYLDPAELYGKDLVCWCAPLPCHGDVLLEVANA